jgi:hypothetical protein
MLIVVAWCKQTIEDRRQDGPGRSPQSSALLLVTIMLARS